MSDCIVQDVLSETLGELHNMEKRLIFELWSYMVQFQRLRFTANANTSIWIRCIFPYNNPGFQIFLMKSVLIYMILCEFVSCITAWWLTATKRTMLHGERWWQVIQNSTLVSITAGKAVKRSYHNLRDKHKACPGRWSLETLLSQS